MSDHSTEYCDRTSTTIISGARISRWAKDAPVSRRVEPAAPGEVMAMPHVGGLHHSYHRHAA